MMTNRLRIAAWIAGVGMFVCSQAAVAVTPAQQGASTAQTEAGRAMLKLLDAPHEAP